MAPKSKAAKAVNDNSDGGSRPYQRNDLPLEDDSSYRVRRDRNNVAVKKSREKSRQRARETAEKMARLRQENDDLERRTVELARELRTLKNLLLDRAGRRPRGGDGASSSSTASCSSASVSAPAPSSSSSRVTVALADPQTVSIDHEYVTSKDSREITRIETGDENDCLELEESVVAFEAADYYD